MKNKLIAVLSLFFSFQLQAAVADFKTHIEIASNPKMKMNARWSSLISSADLATSDDMLEIQKFTQSKEWYLRNAALLALRKINYNAAEIEARKLLSDKALVVRSAAVEIIAERMSDDNKRMLVEEIDKGYNFNKSSSLWIRKQILEKVAKVATERDRALFVKNLFDKDKRISELCANTLEKVTGKKISRKKFVQNWREYAKQENWY
jgi:hypothetical protein